MTNSQTEQNGTLERQLRVSRVAEILDISRASVYDLIKNGELEAIRVGSRLRVRASSLTRLMERSRV